MSLFAHSAIIGHDSVCRTLDRYYTSGKTPQALLFQGVPGIGKAALATEFAAALAAGEEGDVARVQSQIKQDAHPNVRVLRYSPDEGGAHVPLSKVREVLHFFHLSPNTKSDYRVLIVDAVDNLSVAGVNALLKAVEEPPARTCIIVVNHCPQKLLPTLRSRLICLRFHPLSQEQMASVFADKLDHNDHEFWSFVGGQPGLAKQISDEGLMDFVRDSKRLLAAGSKQVQLMDYVQKWFSQTNKNQWDFQLMLAEHVLLNEIGSSYNHPAHEHRLMQTYDSFVKNIDQYRILNLDLQSILCQSLSQLWVSQK